MKERRFIEDISELNKSIEKGRIILVHKVAERVGRLRQKYIGIGNIYNIEIIKDDTEKIAKGILRTSILIM